MILVMFVNGEVCEIVLFVSGSTEYEFSDAMSYLDVKCFTITIG